MPKQFFKYLLLVSAAGCVAPSFANDDATMHQVYETAQAGHLDQAQKMMAQVLRDHPESAKAHYVEAELDARQGQIAAAQGELKTAERLDPGLPFAKPDSVRALREELSLRSAGAGQASLVHASPGAPLGASFSWGPVLVLMAILAGIWMFIRSRRNSALQQYSPGGMPGGYGPSYGPSGMPPNAGGMGSGIMGSVASGLAVGAGVVAGEELAHHFLDGDRRHEGSFIPDDRGPAVDPNDTMGGSDFGVSDSGSWDDNSSIGGDMGGGGGDDWT